MLIRRGSFAALAGMLAALALGAGTAHAAQVTVVDGDRATRVDDPSVPAQGRADLGRPPRTRSRPFASAAARPGRRAVIKALRRARRAHRISRARYRAYRSAYGRARGLWRRLRGARRAQLGYVILVVERMALTRRLIPSRMPVLFLELRRNTQYWRSRPYPGARDWVRFRGSEVLFQYFPGRGLQLHPLGTFKRANALHGFCIKGGGPCRPAKLRRLLDGMRRLAVRRGRRFIAWEYMFDFGGGRPPWISAMATATGLQAYARAAQLLHRPDYVRTARRALGAYATRPPLGVRTRGPLGGIAYLQYSFAPRLFIFNAFLTSIQGLRDFSKLTGDARAERLYKRAEPEARREVPHSDVGDWSLYNWHGHLSDRNYHEYLREILSELCARHVGPVYCTYASRYRGYQLDPPRLSYLGPGRTSDEQLTRLRFSLSKLSAVELKVYKGGQLAHRSLATFRRGSGSFLWRPHSAGSYTVRLGAKELRTGRGLRGRTSATVEVEPGA
ncbi:MAG: D-glucuronyl C5-epimerase family protein [Thermoleophilaceae bacterium]